MSVPHLKCGRQWVGILIPAPAENLYQSSVKFLSLFRSPRPKSLCRSESFRNLYCLHSEGAKNENVLEYSSIWLYEKRNVLISHKRWRKRGHGHQNNFGGVGVGRKFRITQNLELMMFWNTWTFRVLRNIHAPDNIRKETFYISFHISFRFRVTQNLVPMTFGDTWTLNVLRNIHATDDIRSVTV